MGELAYVNGWFELNNLLDDVINFNSMTYIIVYHLYLYMKNNLVKEIDST